MPEIPSDPVEFARNALGFHPDDTQSSLLRQNPHRLLLNCSRQWGKSTVTAAKAVHQAAGTPESLIVALSPSARQSGEFLRKASAFLRKLGIKPRGDGDNEISLLLPNHSRIVGLPGKDATIRGFSSVNMLLIDEAARVADDLYLAVRPMLAASNGQLWLISTPAGKRGFFYDIWAAPDPTWTRISIPATECPRISPAFLEEERRAMPRRFFEQEYLCQFLDSEDTVFPLEILQRALVPIPGLFSPMPHRPLVGEPMFLVGLDLGQQNDPSTVCVIEVARVISGPRCPVTYQYPTTITYTVRHLERIPLGTPYTDIAAHVRALARHPALGRYKTVVVDATGVGRPVVDLLKKSGLGCRIVPVTLTSGGSTTTDGANWRVPRHELLTHLEIGLLQEQLKISSGIPHADTLISELRSLRRKVKDSGEETIHPWRDSQHDDLVFATALAYWRATLFPY